MTDTINVNELGPFTDAPNQANPATGDAFLIDRGGVIQHVFEEDLKTAIVGTPASTDGSFQERIEGTTDGIADTFSFVDTTPASADYVDIFIDGRLRRDFTLDGQDVVFDSPPIGGETYVLIHWQTVGGSGGGGVTDHGALTGLSDDDHSQYHNDTRGDARYYTQTAAQAAFAPIAKGVTNGDSHAHTGGEGAQIAYANLSGLPTLGTAAAADTGDFDPAGTGASEAASAVGTHEGTYDHSLIATAVQPGVLGTAATLNIGTAVGNIPQLEDVGGGTPGLPAVDGSQLLNLPGGSGGGSGLSIVSGSAANAETIDRYQTIDVVCTVSGVEAATHTPLTATSDDLEVWPGVAVITGSNEITVPVTSKGVAQKAISGVTITAKAVANAVVTIASDSAANAETIDPTQGIDVVVTVAGVTAATHIALPASTDDAEVWPGVSVITADNTITVPIVNKGAAQKAISAVTVTAKALEAS